MHLCAEHAGTAGGLDLLFGLLGEITGFDYEGDVGENSLSEDLEISKLRYIEHGDGIGGAGLGLLVHIGGDHAPQSVDVYFGAVVHASLKVEFSHTEL